MGIDYLEIDGHRIPWLDRYKMVSFLAEADLLHHLHGGHDLWKFWQKLSRMQPHHPVFEEASSGHLQLTRTIPFYSHGDEGRTKRKKGILKRSLRGCLGMGTRHFREHHEQAAQQERMGLNMSNSLSTRFMHLAIPKKYYPTKGSSTLCDTIGLEIGMAYRKLQTQGFQYKGQTWHAACLGIVGDNPFLAKCGHLRRSFTRVARRTGEDAPSGICWLCQAGKPNVPFEDLNMNAKWTNTCFLEDPWSHMPPILVGLEYPADPRAAGMFHPDIWHNFHGGIGKHMVCSTVAELLPSMMGTSVDSNMQTITKALDSWRKKSKMTLHYGRVEKETFGIETGLKACPSGGWSKFGDTRVLLSFLEVFLADRTEYVPNELTEEMLRGIRAANGSFRILYRSGFFLTASEASTAGRMGVTFLRSYALLAHATLKEGRNRYPLVPKIHYCHHAWRSLVLCAEDQRWPWVPSPLGTSVQLDEDFIGKVGRWSRRVGEQMVMKRTMQRYLIAAHLTISEAEKEAHAEFLAVVGASRATQSEHQTSSGNERLQLSKPDAFSGRLD